MPDKVADSIAQFSSKIKFSDLDEKVIREVKLRILDSIAVAIGALWSKANRRARRALYRYRMVNGGARVWGSDIKVAPDHAALLNGLLVRYFDFNDTYLSKEPLHPSDMIPAIIGVAESFGYEGKRVITAIAVGYEVGITLCDSESLRLRGWDHVNYTMLGATAGLGNLLEMDEEKIVNALAMSIVPHAAMRQTRAGKVTMWKATAASNACRNSVIASLLAYEGYEGPDQPFVGEMGMINQMLGGQFDFAPIEKLPSVNSPKRILDSYMKFHPVEYHAQSAVDAVYKLLEKGVKYEDIESIHVYTTQPSYDIIVKHPEKWDPQNRETADHSLPYIVASAIVNRGVWIDNFEGDEIFNPKTRELMKKMKVEVDKRLDDLYPDAIANRVEVTLKSGEKLSEEVLYPTGHPKSGDDVEKLVREKFERLTSRMLSEDQINDIFALVDKLEHVIDIGELTELLIL